MAYQLLIDGNDYSAFVFNDAEPMKLMWKRNYPQTLTLAVADVNQYTDNLGVFHSFNDLGAPTRDSTVQLNSIPFGDAFFKGFIAKANDARFTGYQVNKEDFGKPFYGWRLTAVSQEYQLDRLSPRLGALPSLAGRKAKDIIKIVTEYLLPGVYNYDNVLDGQYQPNFEMPANAVWSTIIRSLAEHDGMNYWVWDHKIYYQPKGDLPLGVDYDVTTNPLVTGWSPDRMDLQPTADVIYNDIIVVGDPNGPKGPGKVHTVGDGFEGDFPMQTRAYGVQERIIIDEPWDQDVPDAQKWLVADPALEFIFGAPNMQIIGGSGQTVTYIQLQKAIEISGSLKLIHGEFQFTGASVGRIGCLYQSFDNFTDANQVCGFSVAPSGTDSEIQPMVMGEPAGTSIITEDGHSYVLITRIFAPNIAAWRQYFAAKLDPTVHYGGSGQPINLSIAMDVWDYTITAADVIVPDKINLLTMDLDVSALPSPFLAYLFIQADNMHLAADFTELSYPIQVQVKSAKPIYDQDGIPISHLPDALKTVGFGIDHADCTVTDDKSGLSEVRFYPDPVTTVQNSGSTQETVTTDTNLPVAGELLKIEFTVAGWVMGRVRDFASVSLVSSKYGAPDDGVRTEIVDKFDPLPRKDNDAINIAAAVLHDAVNQQYSGSYKTYDKYCSARPIPGRFLVVNDPARLDRTPINFLVEEVDHTFNGDFLTQQDFHEITLNLSEVVDADRLKAQLDAMEDVKPFQSRDSEALNIIDVLNLPLAFLSDLVEDWALSIVSAGDPWATPPIPGIFQVTVNRTMPSDMGIEVRKWDRGWNQIDVGADPGLVYRSALGVNTVYVPRRSRQNRFFMRYYKGTASVIGASLLQIIVTPNTAILNNGDTVQLQAMGLYSDGTQVDITDLVTFASNNTTIATVSSTGLVTGINSTELTLTADISATLGSVVGGAVITVAPAVTGSTVQRIEISPVTDSVFVGATVKYSAIAYLSDGSAVDVSDIASFSSTVTSVATINGKIATAVTPGSTIITASYSSVVSNQSSLAVTSTSPVPSYLRITVPAGAPLRGPYTITRQVGAAYGVNVALVYSNGSSIDVTSSPNTRYINVNPLICSFDQRIHGGFALQVGLDSIALRYNTGTTILQNHLDIEVV